MFRCMNKGVFLLKTKEILGTQNNFAALLKAHGIKNGGGWESNYDALLAWIKQSDDGPAPGPAPEQKQIGRHGDFGEYGNLVKQYKSHRSADLIRLECASDPVVRQRANWGSVAHARLITPRVTGPAVMDVTGDS